MNEPRYRVRRRKAGELKFSYDPDEHGWLIANVYDEPCHRGGKYVSFANYVDAASFCERMNECPDGAVITNLE